MPKKEEMVRMRGDTEQKRKLPKSNAEKVKMEEEAKSEGETEVRVSSSTASDNRIAKIEKTIGGIQS